MNRKSEQPPQTALTKCLIFLAPVSATASAPVSPVLFPFPPTVPTFTRPFFTPTTFSPMLDKPAITTTPHSSIEYSICDDIESTAFQPSTFLLRIHSKWFLPVFAGTSIWERFQRPCRWTWTWTWGWTRIALALVCNILVFAATPKLSSLTTGTTHPSPSITVWTPTYVSPTTSLPPCPT